MFSIQCFHFQKQKMKWLWHKYCKIKLISGTISHDVSNEPETYLEPNNHLQRSVFSEIVNGLFPFYTP